MNLMNFCFFVSIMAFTAHSLRAAEPAKSDPFQQNLQDMVLENFRGGSDPFQIGAEFVPLETTVDINTSSSKKRKPLDQGEGTKKIRVVDTTDGAERRLLQADIYNVRMDNEDLRRQLEAERDVCRERGQKLSAAREACSKNDQEAQKLRQELLEQKLKYVQLESRCKKIEQIAKKVQQENDHIRKLNAQKILVEEGEILDLDSQN